MTHIRQLTSEGNNRLGYYDRIHFSPDNKRLLYWQHDQANGVALVKVLDLASNKTVEVCTSRAFSFQQGPMAEWVDNHNIIVNSVDPQHNTTCISTIRHVESGRIMYVMTNPNYKLSPNRMKYASCNFPSIYRSRTGYGHSYPSTSNSDSAIVVRDVNSTKNNKYISWDEIQVKIDVYKREMYVNHIQWANNNMFAFFVCIPQTNHRHRVCLFTCNLNKKLPLKLIAVSNYLSHYDWFNANTIKIYDEWSIQNNAAARGFFIINVDTNRRVFDFPARDGHLIHTKNKKHYILDSYEKDTRVELYDDRGHLISSFRQTQDGLKSSSERLDLHVSPDNTGKQAVFQAKDYQGNSQIHLVKW